MNGNARISLFSYVCVAKSIFLCTLSTYLARTSIIPLCAAAETLRMFLRLIISRECASSSVLGKCWGIKLLIRAWGTFKVTNV